MIDTLQVLWIDEKLRERHPVGTLRRENGRFVFTYGDLVDATAHGFSPLPEFRDASREYVSTRLFATFAERLPSIRRSDRGRILSELGLDEPADDFEILARSGGTLATDRLELAERRVPGDTFDRPLIFQVRGTQFHQQPVDRPLIAGEDLRPEQDPTNAFDSHACPLVRMDGTRVGFVPKAYSAAVAAALRAGIRLRVTLQGSVLLPRQQPPSGSEPTWIARLERARGPASITTGN